MWSNLVSNELLRKEKCIKLLTVRIGRSRLNDEGFFFEGVRIRNSAGFFLEIGNATVPFDILVEMSQMLMKHLAAAADCYKY